MVTWRIPNGNGGTTETSDFEEVQRFYSNHRKRVAEEEARLLIEQDQKRAQRAHRRDQVQAVAE